MRWTLLVALVLSGCGYRQLDAFDSAQADSVARVRQDSINRAQPGYVVDSILPIEEELRRFRAGLGDPPRGLSNGASSRDALVASFLEALESADTAALARLTITRAEFAYLVYPSSQYVEGPYRQAPGLAWMRHSAVSGTGLTRLLARMGGRAVPQADYRCAEPASIEGENRLWTECRLSVVRSATDTAWVQLFGGIIEREGRFKILSYANDF